MSSKIHCYVCGCDIGRYGWSKHVQKEKRLYGKDIYTIMKNIRSHSAIKKTVEEEIMEYPTGPETSANDIDS